MEDRTSKWYYILPDGTKAPNMKDARSKLGLGTQGFRALVRKGIVKKIYEQAKTTRYEREATDNK